MEVNKEEQRLCDYGCGQVAQYQLNNGKWCCSKNCVSCPVIKEKNSKGTEKRHKEGRGYKFSNDDRRKASNKRTENDCKRLFKKGSNTSNAQLKNLLVNGYNWEVKCHKCNITSWFGEKIPIELHHIDGDNSNNELSNLEFLCPNCHAITDCWRGKNINNKATVTDKDLTVALQNNSSVRQALIEVGLSPKGGNYQRCYNILYGASGEAG